MEYGVWIIMSMLRRVQKVKERLMSDDGSGITVRVHYFSILSVMNDY